MELEIIKDRKNDVVGRREIDFYVMQESRTPSIGEVKVEICKKLNLSPDSTVITNLSQSFGARQSRGSARSYPSVEAMKRFEKGFLFNRIEKKAKKASGGAAPKAEKKEEKKAEKEEKK